MRIWKWVGILALVVVLVYVGWVIVALNRTATIAVDYVALLNEKASAVPEEERAWPYYREAGIALRENPMPGSVFFDEDIEEPSWPDEKGWNHFEQWLTLHEGTLDTLHEATSKEGFGFILDGEVAEEDRELWPEEYASQQNEEFLDGFLISIVLPQLGPMRKMTLLLSVDAKAAAANGDANRCLQDLQSIMQIGEHVREHPLLISDLVSHAIFNMAFETLGKIVEHKPTLFTSEQYAILENELAALEGLLSIRFDGERYFMYDLLQGIYTDDGNGDGQLIPVDASRMIAYTESVSSDLTSTSLLSALFAPIADVCFASRKEMRTEYDRRMNDIEKRGDLSLSELAQGGSKNFATRNSSNSTLDPYFLTNLLLPALDKAMLQGKYTRAKRDATLAVLYAVQTRNRLGQWPTNLTDAGVVDAWSGQPFIIQLIDGEPLIYSVGCNQEDDNGQYDSAASTWDWQGKSHGDWIVWPNPK